MEPIITEANGKTLITLELPSASIRGIAKSGVDASGIETEYRYEACAQAAQALRKHGEDVRAKHRGGFTKTPATLEEAQAERTRLTAIVPKGDLSAPVAEIVAEKEAEKEAEDETRTR